MEDRAKVIREFELFIRNYHPACTSEGIELDMFREVLSILKEDEDLIRGYQIAYGEGSVK